ncbi:hypothetical protein C3747_186g78c [Trypanosoma cruzi]|uniref:Uncharacterized protein n=2 Tax=Trypanosoma cruzi TaxID=5693 RepID=Q4DPQ1_TRYCC|nr:hypothetical protein, conserved [Trypanosoma cruzi]EAN94486.1 hypothetical protein, conserved [Trypanosoma cruzi]KAF8301206.1 hypothetical protein TcYC6_0054250 [Trypanosoma cruzi]PWV02862.1 hypothetical protein C3747_186g78c [Trypanosoma cruzi]RNC55234.1 hypothetical protein TcCL_ESM07281 [Trypanosoma cruzi]|eukprot:XP_816337.1 hypothetical protein [Trypanosoma cruzi strain CL Brener]
MPIRKKQEVCGKPTQYNLQTCEYDWKYLPDTHFNIEAKSPRRRQPSVQSNVPLERSLGTSWSPVIPRSPQKLELPAVIPLSPAPLMGTPHGMKVEPQAPPLPWSHDELRRLVYANQSEAQRSYLLN